MGACTVNVVEHEWNTKKERESKRERERELPEHKHTGAGDLQYMAHMLVLQRDVRCRYHMAHKSNKRKALRLVDAHWT